MSQYGDWYFGVSTEVFIKCLVIKMADSIIAFGLMEKYLEFLRSSFGVAKEFQRDLISSDVNLSLSLSFKEYYS